MKKNISYQPLISNWEDYLESTNEPDLRGFAKYVLLKDSNISVSLEQHLILEGDKVDHNELENGPYLTPEVAELVFRLSKFIRIYGKPVLKGLGMNSMDEFVILAFLLERKEVSKKDIIIQNLIEFTTGTDMLRRMIKMDLLNERINPADKRQKIISLSDNGKKVLFQIFEKFKNITDVLGNLDNTEREQLLTTLSKLNSFHTELAKEDRK